ncbi:hypothetical protein D3I64_005037 [Escherichia coli]|uniref:MrpH family fimbial adhesin n=1 Tax=Escherichia coli TaxID=562 RepID=UPI0012FFC392|nr:hypothetical protein [Escherichia coli]EER5477472.1 hypothetical protein [Escherichia coli]EER9854464.1 hypothetical protein [Escherichia coli]EEU9969467.1 hypothetical protein [Escherichia coli]EEX2603826.1 hypothetical protein [Escherichia coli]EEX7165239.1 hypothetical protein [Escherichia coli]
MMKKIFLFFLFLCVTNSGWSACNLKGNGKWWKGLSVAGVNIKTNSIKWSGSLSGEGVYDISLLVTMNQGVKYYYSSTTGSSWFREDLPSGVLNRTQDNCSEGYVVTATLQNLSVGGGSIIPSILSGGIGGNSFQLLNNSANIPVIAKIKTPPGSYMVGVTQSSYTETWTGKIYVSSRGVSDGTYQLQIPVSISGVSVWFQKGSNYWDRVDGQQVAKPVQTLQLPLTIRISNGKPVDPAIHCNFDKSAVIDHGVLRKDIANGNSKTIPLKINCNANTSATIKLIGNQNNANSVKINMGRGISSELSISPSDQSQWFSTINQNLKNGSTTVYLKSILQVESDSDVGKFDGAGVAVITIH